MISVVNLTQYGYGMRDCGHRRRKCATRKSQWFSHIRLPPDSLRALAVGPNGVRFESAELDTFDTAQMFDRAVVGHDGQGARATSARICTIQVPKAPTVRTISGRGLHLRRAIRSPRRRGYRRRILGGWGSNCFR